MTAHTFKAALIQQRCNSSIKDNQAKSLAMIREAASKGAELVVLQELHSSLYFCQTEDTAEFDLAETIPGPSSELFENLARELNIVLVASLFETNCRLISQYRCRF